MERTFLVVTAILLTLALSLAACGGDALKAAAPSTAPVGDPVAGEKIFVSACASCHGLNDEGIQGLSKDMTHSELIASKTDQELVEFLKLGRAPGDAPDTAGAVMPPKGGNPSLTDENLYDIVAYIRLLQK